MGYDVIADQLRLRLSDGHLHILSDLFQTMNSYNDGVDALCFKVKHHQLERCINDLYQKDLIQRRTGKDHKNVYRPSLLALPLIDDETARTIENTCDAIVQCLYRAFKNDPYVRLTIGDVANQVSADEGVLQEALRYLRDMPLGLVAISDDKPLVETDNVPIIESIMKYPSLLDVYKQLLQWTMANNSEAPFFVAEEEPMPTPFVSLIDELLTPSNRSIINAEIVRVLQELRLALLHGLRTLSAVGIRTVIDMIVDDQSKRDLGSFQHKIQWLKDEGLVPELTRKHLLEVIDLGSSAAHRGYNPKGEHLKTALMMLNHLVQSVYTMPNRINEMKRDKPTRARSLQRNRRKK